jgi:hypothetical protein
MVDRLYCRPPTADAPRASFSLDRHEDLAGTGHMGLNRAWSINGFMSAVSDITRPADTDVYNGVAPGIELARFDGSALELCVKMHLAIVLLPYLLCLQAVNINMYTPAAVLSMLLLKICINGFLVRAFFPSRFARR